LLQPLFHDFAPQHIYGYAFVTKSLQPHVSLLFSAPRYDNYCKIWVYDGDEGFYVLTLISCNSIIIKVWLKGK